MLSNENECKRNTNTCTFPYLLMDWYQKFTHFAQCIYLLTNTLYLHFIARHIKILTKQIHQAVHSNVACKEKYTNGDNTWNDIKYQLTLSFICY